jgi:uncharacterized membrane protein YkoI
MKRSLVTALGFAVLFSLAATDGTAAQRRGRDRDEDVARQALQRGEVLPIARILQLAAQHQPGDVIEVQLDERRGRLEYQLKVLAPSGRVVELALDARTGALLRLED